MMAEFRRSQRNSLRYNLLFVGMIFLSYICIPTMGFGGAASRSNQQIDDEDNNQDAIDLTDPELLQAMEIFANMSPDEMKEAMNELKDLLGDDPETLAAIEQVFNEIPKMEASDVQRSLQDMVEEDELIAATEDALELLRHGHWDLIWEKRDLIRDAVIASGKISPEDATLFQTDTAAWEEELKSIWNMLQQQATMQQQQQQQQDL